MPTPSYYKYELWNGKTVIGIYKSEYLIPDACLNISTSPGSLKEIYGKKYKVYKFDMIKRIVSDNGIDLIIRRCIDVRRKPKKQIAWLLK